MTSHRIPLPKPNKLLCTERLASGLKPENTRISGKLSMLPLDWKQKSAPHEVIFGSFSQTTSRPLQTSTLLKSISFLYCPTEKHSKTTHNYPFGFQRVQMRVARSCCFNIFKVHCCHILAGTARECQCHKSSNAVKVPVHVAKQIALPWLCSKE